MPLHGWAVAMVGKGSLADWLLRLRNVLRGCRSLLCLNHCDPTAFERYVRLRQIAVNAWQSCVEVYAATQVCG